MSLNTEPLKSPMLRRRIAFELMRSAAAEACNAISLPMDLVRRLELRADDALCRLESALQLSAMARRTIDLAHREAWANESAPSDAQWTALMRLDRQMARRASYIANWIESEITSRHCGAEVGKRTGEWIDWNFPLDVDFIFSTEGGDNIPFAIDHPCMTHRFPSGKVRISALRDECPRDSVIRFDRHADEIKLRSGIDGTAIVELSSDLLKETLLFVPEVAYLAGCISTIRLRCENKQLALFL